MSVQNLFHVIHIVDDLHAAELFYGAVFPLESFSSRHYSETDKRWASLWLIGDNFVIELMEPSRRSEDRSASIPKFHDRFGQRLHSLAWYSDDLRALTKRFHADGIRVVDADHGTIFTHPKDTFGQLQFQTGPPEVPVPDPRFAAGWARSTESIAHPLTLIRSSHITTAVADVETAKAFYTSGLGALTIFEQNDEVARRAFMFVGSDTIIELAQPMSSGTRLARDLEENGQLPHSLCFLVDDIAAAANHVKAAGVSFEELGPTSLLLDPSASFGTLIELTSIPVPGDSR